MTILPYHGLGADKYQRLGRAYELPDVATMGPERVAQVMRALRGFGLRVEVTG